MTYDLSNILHRKQFVARANKMLQKKTGIVTLADESRRTPNQNKYLHVLIRIMATETGVSEGYSKNIYFKKLSNPDLFVRVAKNPVTKMPVEALRSSSELTVEEMSKAITNFRKWAAENGYYLPEASIDDDGKLTFASEKDKQAFHQAEIETSRVIMQ